ncbi:MAG: S-layer homology domain-containing protein, partial [Oscillospiraceae bacterium]|nr:S-layer homology domain-containing protein [Oscillospiraceae bacterium]
ITDGTNPNAPITREQLVTILWRYYVGGGVPDAPQSRNLSGYTDSAQISDWARDAVAWAVGRGILQGDASGLRSGDNVKRSEVAAILRRYTAG